MTNTTGAPHTYKEQRRLEREAYKTRENLISHGARPPGACGYTYMPSKSKQFPDRPLRETACWRNAGMGTTHLGKGYCNYHEWKAETQMSRDGGLGKARQAALESAKFFGEPINVDPHTALLQEVHRSQGIVVWLEIHLQELHADGTPKDALLVQMTKQLGAVPSVWMQLYQSERQNLVKVASAAIKAGVAERKVELAEQQARLLAAVMMNFIHDKELGLTPTQLMAAPGLVRRHLIGATTHEVIDANGRELGL